jgi:hypothetical protein
MESIENTSQPTPGYDGHALRLTTLEKTVVDLQCENALFQQRVDNNFESLRVLVTHTESKLRLEFQVGLKSAEQAMVASIVDESKRVSTDLNARVDRLEVKVDFLAKWFVAAQVTTLGFVVAIAARMFLS